MYINQNYTAYNNVFYTSSYSTDLANSIQYTSPYENIDEIENFILDIGLTSIQSNIKNITMHSASSCEAYIQQSINTLYIILDAYINSKITTDPDPIYKTQHNLIKSINKKVDECFNRNFNTNIDFLIHAKRELKNIPLYEINACYQSRLKEQRAYSLTPQEKAKQALEKVSLMMAEFETHDRKFMLKRENTASLHEPKRDS